MTRTHLLSTTVLGLALLAAPALAQRQGAGGEAPTAQNRATAEVDRMHKGNGTNGGPAELLRFAQDAMRRGQMAQANELLERAETRLLRATGGESARPAQGEPAHHVAEARRALAGRDRAEAMRHTNLAIATTRDEGSATGSDAGRRGAQGGGGGVDSGMGALPGRAVVRDGGSAGASVSRAEGIVLAQQSGPGAGGRGAPTGLPPTGLPPGDSLPGWSGPRSGTAPAPRGGATGPLGGAPQGGFQGTAPQGFVTDPALGGNSRGGAMTSGSPSMTSGPSSSSMTGGEAARVGGAPPSDTSRAPGSSGISGAGVGNSGVGGPIR